MRWILALLAAAFLVCSPAAELTFVKDIFIKDADKWQNLSLPSDVWPSGNTLYVLDTNNHRIVEFYKDEPTRVIVGSVSASGGMLFPKAFWRMGDRFYITTGGNDVVIYENNNFLYGLAVPGSYAFSFDQPSGVAVYSGVIYVSDTVRGVIKKFNAADRTFIDTIGTSGFGEEQFSEPAGIDARGGLLYFADKGNNRIQVFKPDGTHVKSLRGAYECSLNAPRGVSVNDEGFVFVSDSGNNRIVVFDRNWDCVGMINGSATIPLSNPIGIRVDSSNNVYVADSSHARIRVFHYTPYYQSKEEAEKKISAADALHGSMAELRSAAALLGIPYEDTGKDLLDRARAELTKGNFSNAYFNATLSSSETQKMNSSLGLKINAEVLKRVLGDEGVLDAADQEAVRYKLTVDSRPLRAELSRIRAMLDAGRYADAAFNTTRFHSRVLEFNSSISGSSGDSAKVRDTLLLAISDAKNELSEVSISASQYKVDVNSTEITLMLESAKDACNKYDFDSCRGLLSSAKGKVNEARLLIAAHMARVDAARQRVWSVQQELSKAYSASYFLKPDLSKAEKELSDAEAIVNENPDGAVEKAKAALSLIDGSRAEINRSNLLIIIGIGVAVLLLVAVVVVYYVTRGKPRKRRNQ